MSVKWDLAALIDEQLDELERILSHATPTIEDKSSWRWVECVCISRASDSQTFRV